MGRELARQLVAEGCNVAICDVSAENMAETKRLCEVEKLPQGLRITTHIADVSIEDQLKRFRDELIDQQKTDKIHLLFNNAGIGGGGSLFTSTLPPLLVPGIREAVRVAKVPRIYVCNLLQQPGETEGYRASDHVARIFEHVGDDLVDGVLVSRNRAEHGVPVPVDRGGLRRQGVRVFGARLAGEWQHDPDRLARTLVRLSRWNRDELQ